MEIGEMVAILEKGSHEKRAFGRLLSIDDEAGQIEIKVMESNILSIPLGIAKFEGSEDRHGQKDYFYLHQMGGAYFPQSFPTYLIGNREEEGVVLSGDTATLPLF